MASKGNQSALRENHDKTNTDMGNKRGSYRVEDQEVGTDDTTSENIDTDNVSKNHVATDKSRSKLPLNKSNNEASTTASETGSEPETWSMIKNAQTTSRKVTLGKSKTGTKGLIGQRKPSQPGVALLRTNPKLVNFKNKKEAERLWWEQTDAWAPRWGAAASMPTSNKGGDDDAWAAVHLPKVHWKKRKALEESKMKEQEEGSDGGDEMEPKKKVAKAGANKKRRV